MERFSDDVLGLILIRVSERGDRSSCSLVCKQWERVEGLSRTSLRVLEPDRMPKFLPRFPNLTSLEINKRITDRNLKSIAAMCPNLRVLNLSLNRDEWCNGFRSKDFGSDGLRAIAVKCGFLMKVSLKRRELVPDAAVIALISNAKNLKILDLSWCSRITDESLEAMEKIASLAELYLLGCSQITNAGLMSLALGLPSTSLRTLDVSECDQVTDYAFYFMQQMSCLQELRLADCGPKITDEGGLAISRISTLRTLDISWLINITDETLAAVAENCKNLVEIRLVGCELVTGYGVSALACHGSLEVINMSRCNQLSIYAVEEIVMRCNSLRHLVLDKSTRAWLSPLAIEKLSGSYRVDWV